MIVKLAVLAAAIALGTSAPAQNETPKGALEATVEVDAGSTRTFQLLIESTDVAVGTVVGRLATSDGELAAVVDVDGRSRCEGEPRLTGLHARSSACA